MSSLLPAFRYHIVLGDGTKPDGGFSECSGIEVTTEILEYTEGGVNGYVHKLPTRTKASDLVLKRGMLVTSDLWSWIREVRDGDYTRRNGFIVLLKQDGSPGPKWNFVGGLPIKWTGPALSASQSAVATETLIITYEQFHYEDSNPE